MSEIAAAADRLNECECYRAGFRCEGCQIAVQILFKTFCTDKPLPVSSRMITPIRFRLRCVSVTPPSESTKNNQVVELKGEATDLSNVHQNIQASTESTVRLEIQNPALHGQFEEGKNYVFQGEESAYTAEKKSPATNQ